MHSIITMSQLAATGLLVSRMSLALFLLPSAIAKARDVGAFVEGVRDYAILPEPAVPAVALALPIIEGSLGVALLVGIAPPVTGVLTALLMSLFIGAVAVNLRRDRDINCSCYGVGATKRIGSATIARNTALLGLGLGVAVMGALTLGPDNWLHTSGWGAVTSVSDVVLVALLTSCAVALVYLTEWAIHVEERARSLAANLNGEVVT